MPNPKRKHSKSRTSMRRAHDHLKPPAVGTCPNCQEPVLAHRVCTNCGFYKGEKYNLPGIKEKE